MYTRLYHLRYKVSALLLFLTMVALNAIAQSNDLKLPPGFHIEDYASNISGARFMALGENGIVFVGTKEDSVYALIPIDSGAHAQAIKIASHLNSPNGVAFYQGDLYVAEINRIIKFPKIISHLQNPLEPIVILNSLPANKHHGLRVIHISNDGYLYITIGVPCNACDRRKINPYMGTIARVKTDGTHLEIFAKGIRNSMGFDWNPKTDVLWFTDNGQDRMGDNVPPDEINRAPKQGLDFGFPYVYGNNIPSPHYKVDKTSLKYFTPPSYNLPAHVAALGLEFYTGQQFPKPYQNQMFIAEHGSWDRSIKVGYQVIMAKVDKGKIISVTPVVSGWLTPESTKKSLKQLIKSSISGKGIVSGRPVDILTLHDGSMLISDDYANKIYRVAYDKS